MRGALYPAQRSRILCSADVGAGHRTDEAQGANERWHLERGGTENKEEGPTTTMTKTRPHPTFDNVGSLVTYQDEGGDRCLGYLMAFDGYGVFDPTFGKVEITPEQADIHNKLLDHAVLAGLDENCHIGMCGSFYVGKQDGRLVIKTFLGTLVSSDCTQHGRVVTFTRGGKWYRGRTSQEQDLFNFRRVA